MTGGASALLGDMDTVAAVGRDLMLLDHLQNGMYRLRDGIESVQASGESRAVDRLIAVCRPVEQRAGSVAAARLRAGNALVEYASRVAALQTDARLLQSTHAEATAEHYTASSRLADVDPSSADAGLQSALLQSRLDESTSALMNLERMLEDVDAARRALDNECAGILLDCCADLGSASGAGSAASGSGPSPAVSLASYLSGAALVVSSARVEAALPTGIPPEEAAVAWEGLGLTRPQIAKLPFQSLLLIANCDGLPAWARDAASRAALSAALKDPQSAYKAMGFNYRVLSLGEFTSQLKGLRDALSAAEQAASFLPGEAVVQLVGLGNHHSALTSSISLGDLDTASLVGVNVPGMNSNVGEMEGAVRGAASLFRSTSVTAANSSCAIVTWFGYRAPGMPPGDWGVAGMERAKAGGVELADFIDGVFESRPSGLDPAIVVLGHSYGSTTAAEGLKLTEHCVAAFIAYGSAGIEAGTTLDDMNVNDVYATMADGDGVAGKGIAISGRIDPRSLAGVSEFSSEGDNGMKPVTAHDMFVEDDAWGFFNWGGKTGYLTAGTNAVEAMAEILAELE